MDSNVYISYIVPCYNVEQYLPRCIDSLKRQNIPGIEIEFIMVNDGSPDNSLDILRDFERTDNRVVLINQNNQGVSAARNSGFKMARGKYVFFLDGDDYLTDEASQLVYDESQVCCPDIIIPNAYFVFEGDESKRKKWDTFSGIAPGTYSIKDFVDNANQLPLSVKVYKREVLERYNILFDEDLRVGEVFTFFLHTLICSRIVCLTERRMMNYVMCHTGTTKGLNIERDRQIIKTVKRIDEYARLSNLNLKAKESYNVSIYKIVNTFGLVKYLDQSTYSSPIGMFLDEITKDEAYANSVKYLLFKKPRLNTRFLICLLSYFLPINISYRILRALKISKSFFYSLLWN